MKPFHNNYNKLALFKYSAMGIGGKMNKLNNMERDGEINEN